MKCAAGWLFRIAIIEAGIMIAGIATEIAMTDMVMITTRADFHVLPALVASKMLGSPACAVSFIAALFRGVSWNTHPWPIGSTSD